MCTANASAFDPKFDRITFLMPAWMVPVGIAAGQAIIRAAGQSGANKQNRKEAQRNRLFQERMSSTAFQRGKQDLTKAGLNPALMYGQGGRQASSPSGAAAMGQKSITEGMSGGVSSAMQLKRLTAELRLLEAQTRKTEGEAKSAEIEGLTRQDWWQRVNHPGGSTLGPGGDIDIPNPRNLAALFAADFDKRISESDAQKVRVILLKLQQPGAEASASMMKEIEKLNPQARAGLLMLLGVMGRGRVPGG